MQKEYAQAIADILVNAVMIVPANPTQSTDAGELLAAGLRDAVTHLFVDVGFLVTVNPESEASAIVVRMATTGNSTPVNLDAVVSLTRLFVEMAGKQDTGEIVARACAKVVDTLHGYTMLLADSKWFWELAKLSTLYAGQWPDNPYK